MGIDVTSWAMATTSAFSAWQQYEAGQAANEAYKAQAAELKARTAYEQRLALEEMKEMHREGRTAEGQVIAATAKSGLRVGGSAVTLTQAIRQKVERRKAVRSFQFQEAARQYGAEAAMLRYMGERAKFAGTVQAGRSLLSGFISLAERKEQLGRSWGGLFFPPKAPTQATTQRTTEAYKSYRPSGGYGTFL